MHKRALVWLRRDLRTADHRAWSEAEKHADEIAVVFIFDKNILNKLENDDRRITFIVEALQEIDETLKSKGSSLIVRYGDPLNEIAKVSKELKIEALFVNRDYEPYAKKRDRAVQSFVEKEGIHFYSFKDHVIFEAQEVKNKSGNFFKIFTPYSKAWRAKVDEDSFAEAKVTLKKALPESALRNIHQGLSLEKAGFKKRELFVKTGRSGGGEQLKTFQKHIAQYKDHRNFPALDHSTSQLSTHLRFGTLSPRELFKKTQGKDQGTSTWHTELIWRDFYQMLLDSFPQLPEKCFQAKCDDIEWPGSKKHFQAWCEGKTGYPLIDATMRHFNKSGWMHNRLRMIVASFLTKDLLCHWKWGEDYFAKNLLDFELASNNGGWQWAASVGCDAQPYFRIFNPVLQSQAYDPHGSFIRAELPELAKVPDKFIHAPWLAKKEDLKNWNVMLGKDYPQPLVNHAEQKLKAIQLFRSA